MTVGRVVALLYLTATLLHGADRVHGLVCVRGVSGRRAALRLLAVAALCVAYHVWHAHEPGPGALLVVLAGVMSMCTLVALLAPLMPRVVWSVFVVTAGMSSVCFLTDTIW